MLSEFFMPSQCDDELDGTSHSTVYYNIDATVIYIVDNTQNKITFSDQKLRKTKNFSNFPQSFTSSYQNKSKVDHVIDKIFVKRVD